MRLAALVTLAGALVVMNASAQSAWRAYISHPVGFAFAAPGELRMEKGTYRSEVAGARNTTVFKFVHDGVEYRAIVIDMTDQANNGATLLGEAQFMFQDKKKVLMDTFANVDRHLGRKMTIDLPNSGGRTTAAFYFVDGRIVSLQATVLPSNGDYETPEMGRFVDSIAFNFVRAADDAVELPPLLK
jgi:hypothetical protein